MPSKPARGFSLPELVVVVAIIAILAAILFVLFAHARDNANVATCESNERMIAEALESYALDHYGQYPNLTGPVTAATFGGRGNPYFTGDSLTDPANGMPYLYTDGPGTCADPNAEYQIIDQGGHTSTSLLALLSADASEDSIAFCSSTGLYAFQAGASSAGMARPNLPSP